MSPMFGQNDDWLARAITASSVGVLLGFGLCSTTAVFGSRHFQALQELVVGGAVLCGISLAVLVVCVILYCIRAVIRSVRR